MCVCAMMHGSSAYAQSSTSHQHLCSCTGDCSSERSQTTHTQPDIYTAYLPLIGQQINSKCYDVPGGVFSEEANVIGSTTIEQSEYYEIRAQTTSCFKSKTKLRHLQIKFQRETASFTSLELCCVLIKSIVHPKIKIKMS